MNMSEQDINDIITASIIKTLKIVKEVKDQGDDLNEVDFDYIISCRERDLADPTVLENLNMPDDYSEQV